MSGIHEGLVYGFETGMAVIVTKAVRAVQREKVSGSFRSFGNV